MAQPHKICYLSRKDPFCRKDRLQPNLPDVSIDESFKQEENPVHIKIGEMKTAICNRIDEQVTKTRRERELASKTFDEVDSKLQSLLDLQDTILDLRHELRTSEKQLNNVSRMVDNLDRIVGGDEDELRLKPRDVNVLVGMVHCAVSPKGQPSFCVAFRPWHAF